MSDTHYGHRSDGTFCPERVSDLCDWLIEYVFAFNLDAYDEDRELRVLRDLLRRRREYVRYAERMAPCFEDPEWVAVAQESAHKLAVSLPGVEYLDPVEERIFDRGFVRGMESGILGLAERFQAFEGIGNIFRAPVRVED